MSEVTIFNLPDAITQWLMLPNPHGNGRSHCQRVKRLEDFAKKSYENSCALNKAWKALDSAKKSPDDLLNLFLVWPDNPTVQPFQAIYGKRAVDHQEEGRSYQESARKVSEILALLKPDYLRKLLSDIPANGDGKAALDSYRTLNRIETMRGLRSLHDMLNAANPQKKYLTKQPFSQDADVQTYIILLAELNRYLSSSKHSAIATIANANYPDCQVTGAAIGKAWKRHFKDGIYIES